MRKALVSAIALALAAGGCTVEVTFNALGDDVSLDGSWLVNGETPDAANCAAAGISTVSVAFFDDKGDRYIYDELTFACADGGFDTRPAAVLAFGAYQTRWYAFDSAGLEIGSGAMMDLVVNSPITHATLAEIDFVTTPGGFDASGTDAELTGDWTINGVAPDATNCAELGIDQVALVFYDSADTGLTQPDVMGMAPCTAGKFDSMPMRIIRYGSFRTQYRALAAGGTIVAESMPLDLVVASPITRAMLAPVDFVSAATLEAMVRWDTDPDPMVMADADCATAGVTTMSHTLNPMGMPMTVIDMAVDAPCIPTLQFNPIDNGEYSLYLEGGDAMGRKLWMSTCDMLVVDGGVDSYNCFVDKMAAM